MNKLIARSNNDYYLPNGKNIEIEPYYEVMRVFAEFVLKSTTKRPLIVGNPTDPRPEFPLESLYCYNEQKYEQRRRFVQELKELMNPRSLKLVQEVKELMKPSRKRQRK